MKIERLIALASARGISLDLGRPSREIPREHRRRPRERRDAESGSQPYPGVQTADGRQDRPKGPRRWTPTDLALAAANMPRLQWAAFRWCIAGPFDPDARLVLRAALLEHALNTKERERWRKRMKRGRCKQCGCLRSQDRYVEDLCELALWEGYEPSRFGTETARADFFGLTPQAWHREGSKMHQAVLGYLMSLYGCALGHLRLALKEIDDTKVESGKRARPRATVDSG